MNQSNQSIYLSNPIQTEISAYDINRQKRVSSDYENVDTPFPPRLNAGAINISNYNLNGSGSGAPMNAFDNGFKGVTHGNIGGSVPVA